MARMTEPIIEETANPDVDLLGLASFYGFAMM